IAKPAGSAPTKSRNTPAIWAVPSSVTKPKKSIPSPKLDTVPSKDPSLAKAVIPVLPTASKKPPEKPTPAKSMSNKTAIGPLKSGLPESTGLVGLAPSPVIKVLGEDGSNANEPVGLPTTQADAAAPGQSTP